MITFDTLSKVLGASENENLSKIGEMAWLNELETEFAEANSWL
jgi:hypothetical protein